jgi:hypothetical protein
MNRITAVTTPSRFEVHYQQMHTGQMFIYRFTSADVLADWPAHPLLVRVLAAQCMQGRLDTCEARTLFTTALAQTAMES